MATHSFQSFSQSSLSQPSLQSAPQRFATRPKELNSESGTSSFGPKSFRQVLPPNLVGRTASSLNSLGSNYRSRSNSFSIGGTSTTSIATPSLTDYARLVLQNEKLGIEVDELKQAIGKLAGLPEQLANLAKQIEHLMLAQPSRQSTERDHDVDSQDRLCRELLPGISDAIGAQSAQTLTHLEDRLDQIRSQLLKSILDAQSAHYEDLLQLLHQQFDVLKKKVSSALEECVNAAINRTDLPSSRHDPQNHRDRESMMNSTRTSIVPPSDDYQSQQDSRQQERTAKRRPTRKLITGVP